MLKTFILFIILPIALLFGTRDNKATFEPSAENSVIIENIATSSPKEIVVANKEIKKVEKEPVIKKKIKETPTPIVKVEVPEIVPDFEKINILARNATVNILCSTEGTELSPISGTGVMIDPRGLILTNAHIGQYLLLKDFQRPDFVDCVIRTGSPAYPRYKIELVYISPEWVMKNKDLLKQTDPKGTGERDFAFIRITGRIDGSPIETLPFIPINNRELVDVNESVLLSSYPAGFLGGISILHDLNITSAITKIADVYTFGETTIDLISVPGTVVSQRGSSGGAVVDKYSTLLGIISTSSNGKTTGERNLYAITGAYINRSLQNEINLNLLQFLSQDISEFAKLFQETTAPTLTKIITDELI